MSMVCNIFGANNLYNFSLTYQVRCNHLHTFDHIPLFSGLTIDAQVLRCFQPKFPPLPYNLTLY